MRGILTVMVLAAAATGGQAQDQALDDAAERAREAWFSHNAAALVENSPRLLVQLPGTDPSVALGPAQAAALLKAFLAPAEEVETEVRAAREVEPGRGYVELQRKYRIAGTQSVQVQSLLLGYRMGSQGWVLIELRVVG